MTDGRIEFVEPTIVKKTSEQNEAKAANKLDSLPKESLINLLKKQVTITKQLKQQLTNVTGESELLREQLKALGENNDHTVMQLELSDYKKSLQLTKKKLETAETAMAQKEKLLNEVVEKMKILTERNMAFEDDRQAYIKDIDKLTALAQENEVKLKEMKKREGDLKKSSEETEKKIKTELSGLESIIERQSKVLEDLRAEVKHTKEENLNLVRINQRMENNFDSVCNDFKQYKERAEFLLNSQRDQTEHKVGNGFELEEMSRQLLQNEREIGELNDKLIHIQHELSSQKERNASIKSELEESRMSMSLVQKDFNEQRKRLLNEYEERVKSLIADNEKFKCESSEWRDRALNAKVERTPTSNTQEVIEMTKQVEQLRDELLIYKRKEALLASEELNVVKKESHYKKSFPNPINFNIDSYYRNRSRDASESLTIPDDNLLQSLKNVIASQDEDETNSTLNFDTYSLSDSLIMDPEVYAQKLEHMKELLEDTEDTNAKLEDQVRVLKEEIRRNERGQARDNHLSKNSEYLKNIVMKFLAPEKINDGRLQLLPVLCTLLSLTTEEKDKIQEYVTSQNTQNSTPPPSEWSGYFGPLSGIF